MLVYPKKECVDLVAGKKIAGVFRHTALQPSYSRLSRCTTAVSIGQYQLGMTQLAIIEEAV